MKAFFWESLLVSLPRSSHSRLAAVGRYRWYESIRQQSPDVPGGMPSNKM
jgi:hypothetical protein